MIRMMSDENNKAVPSMKTITCLSINLQKGKVATAEIDNRKDEIVFMQEPYQVNGKVKTNVPSTRIVSSNKDVRAALRINTNLSPWPVPAFTDGDMSTANVLINNTRTYVSSIYLDILHTTRKETMMKLVQHCTLTQTPLIMCIDTNSHSSLWGCECSNKRGEELEEYFFNKDLIVLNEGQEPTFETIRAKSIIDVTVINRSALQHLTTPMWCVEKITSTSPSSWGSTRRRGSGTGTGKTLTGSSSHSWWRRS